MKKFITFIMILTFFTLPLSACKKDNSVEKIKINEVTHSVFYTPLYLAIENGYFKEQGMEIELTNGGGADNSMTAILSGNAHIGLMGPETVIYVFNQNKKDYPKVFGQLTQTDGAFLVSRNAEPDFKWENLKGKEILAGRKGGVPAMTFEYVLNQMGLFDKKDVTLNFDIKYNLMTSAFLGGTGDYCTVFEPTASEYQNNGKWHIVASIGEKAGEIPYTSFIALSSYINNHKETLKKFMTALKKAHDYMATHNYNEISKAIIKQFPSTSISSIESSVKNYKEINAWKTNLQATESSFVLLQNIMKNAGELTEKVDFNKIVDNSIAQEIFN